MTGSDITLYPVSSMNDKDFQTLMNIYLDAVFNPLIYDDSRILDQEGWHRDLENPEAPITYKGVVYNEMKGAFSSPTREWGYLVDKHLFPDTPYRFSSGGYPDSIPTLTHTAFLDFHRKYYHPSNAYIFLYGDGDLAAELAFIDKNYLSNYTVSNQIIDIPIQKPFDSLRSATGVYPATEDAELTGQSYLSLSFVSGLSVDQQLGMGLHLLAQVLFNNESAPVRLAIQEAGIGQDIGAWIDDLRQNVFHVRVQNANSEETDAFKNLVFKTLQQVVSEGIDPLALAGALNRMEFGLREGNTPQKGLSYNRQALGTWFWSDDPFDGLEYEKPLAALKTAIPNGYLEDLISSYFLNNPHTLLFTLNPQPGLEKTRSARLEQELATYKSSLNESEIRALSTYTQELVDYQKSEESPEALATIPLLDLADINPTIDWYEVTEHQVARVPYLHFDAFTNDISYLKFFFDLRVLREEQLPYASLLAVLLGSVGTETYTFGELDNALDTHLGGFSTYLSSYLEDQNDAKMIPKFVVSTKVLSSQQQHAFDLTEEILLRTKLADIDRLKAVLSRHQSRLSASVKRDGLGYARTRLFSYSTKDGLFDEVTGGLEYYWFITDLVNNFETKKDSLITELQSVSQILFTRRNLLGAATSTAADLKTYRKNFKHFSKQLPKKSLTLQEWSLSSSSKNEGLMAASKVQYVLQGTDYKALGYQWNGKIMVLNQIISREWLKNQVRVIGGAYGGFARFSPSGHVYFGSYRDPNLAETLENYAKTPAFLKELKLTEKEMTRFIIGTISSLDRPLTPSQKGNVAVSRYFRKATAQQLQQDRDAVLSTTQADIKAYEEMVSAILKNSNICIYGNEETIKENKNLFEKLILVK